MMKKALWALALLFIVSGCDDNKYSSPPRHDNKVNTTLNFEYNLNYATTPGDTPASYTEAPAFPSSLVAFRVVMELYKVVETPGEPTTYQFYDRQYITASRHELGEDGNLLISNTRPLDKFKFKIIAWADYVLASNESDRNFATSHYMVGDDDTRGLRYVSEARPAEPNSSFINEAGLSGTREFDLTIYEDSPISSATVDLALSRPIGAIYLVATDLDEFKAQAPSEEYYNANFRPVRSVTNFGTYDEETAPYAGYPQIYNVFDGGVRTPIDNMEKRYTIGNPTSDGKLVIANFFLFADDIRTEQSSLTISIYGAQGGQLIKFELPDNIELTPNYLNYVEGPFLMGGRPDDDFNIRIVDRFDATDDFEIVADPIP